MHTLLCAQWYAVVAALVVAGAALGAPPVHGAQPPAVRRLVADPVPGAFEPVEDVCASCVIDLVKGMSIRFLHGHGVAFPVATNIWIIWI